jgi:GTPase SAR1 family protein
VDEPIFIYNIGTAGSGKSRFTGALKRWLYEQEIDSITVNLDPGAESTPYEPDIDIRDWIVLSDVMDKYGLGPNGAQVVAADLLALRAPEIKDVVDSFRPQYVLVDTPGQTELFVFRDSGRVVIDFLSPGRGMLAFLVDPFLAKRPSAFVSQLMLSATTQFRFQMPLANVLTKVDVMKSEDVERLKGWANDADALQAALFEEQADLYNQLNVDVSKILEGMGTYTSVFPVSSETLEGIEDVYAHAQSLFAGGEDATPPREPRDSA